MGADNSFFSVDIISFLNVSVLLHNVASLGLTLQRQTRVRSPTPVHWTRNDTDPTLMTFDLRFVQGKADIGLALANLEMGEDDQFGTASTTFPAEGHYVLKAVMGSPTILVGTSNKITVVGLNTFSQLASASATILTPTETSSSTSALETGSTSTSPPASNPSQPGMFTIPSSGLSKLKRNLNLPAIAGSIIGGLLILAFLALFFVVLGRRRRAFKRRLTFHKDMMVQPRMMIRPHLDLPSWRLLPESQVSTGNIDISAPNTATPDDYKHDPTDVDVEQGLVSAASRPLGSGHIVPSPRGPRPSIKRATAMHTVTIVNAPHEPAPLRTQRQNQLTDRIEMLQRQMEEVQQSAYSSTERGRDSVHVLEEMQREMAWLRDHMQSAWGMGLTDVLPVGHARYMTP